MNKTLFITINAVVLGLIGLYVGLFFLLKSSYHADEWFISAYKPIIKLSVDEPVYQDGQIYEGWILGDEIRSFFNDQQLSELLQNKPMDPESIAYILPTLAPAQFNDPKYTSHITHSGYTISPHKAEIKAYNSIQWMDRDYKYIYTAVIIGYTNELCTDFIEKLNLKSED